MTATSGSNTISFADLQKLATECGSVKGRGNDAQIGFAVKLVEGAYFTSVDLEEDKHGSGKDDATVLADLYVKTQTGSSLFDKKANSADKLKSCFRTLIKFGMWPHGGTGEPIATMNNFLSIWRKERANAANKGGDLEDAFNGLMKLARTQIRRETLVEQGELRDLCFKKAAKEKTDEARLKQAAKMLYEVKKHNASTHITSAITQIAAELKAIAAANAKTAQAEKAAKAKKSASAPSAAATATA